MRFNDSMDPTRQIEPTQKVDGRSTVCRIYFNDSKGGPRYVGLAPVPTRLIGAEPGSWESHVGFTAKGD